MVMMIMVLFIVGDDVMVILVWVGGCLFRVVVLLGDCGVNGWWWWWVLVINAGDGDMMIMVVTIIMIGYQPILYLSWSGHLESYFSFASKFFIYLIFFKIIRKLCDPYGWSYNLLFIIT